MRLFVAIPLPDEVREELIKLQEMLRESNTPMKLVDKENMHLTLKFIGDGNPEEWKAKIEKLDEKPFEMILDKIGSFLEGGKARVIWAGCEAPQSLLNIHRVISEESMAPHVTIARNRGKPDGALLELIGKEIHVPVKVERVQLLNSRQTPKGRKYEVLHEKVL